MNTSGGVSMRDADWLKSLKRVQRVAPTRELADLIRQTEKRLAPKLPSALPQLVFAVVTVYCPPQDGRISVAECIKQQSATEPSGGGRGFALRERCKSCVLRDVHRALAPAYRPPRFQRFNIAKQTREAAARKRLWQSGALGRVPTADDPPSDPDE